MATPTINTQLESLDTLLQAIDQTIKDIADNIEKEVGEEE